ncbi:MAG: hypothetical protein ABWX59_03330 [Microbacteriaceae bacterium]
MEAGGNVQSAVAYNKAALGWYLADAAARLSAGQAAVQMLDFPFRRAFNETNIGDLTLVPRAVGHKLANTTLIGLCPQGRGR